MNPRPNQGPPGSQGASQAALAGVKVLEIAQNAAIPQCGRLLAGMGADVVKVEPLAGDSMRHVTEVVELESRAYATINPGKRAMSIDLGAEGVREVVDRLVGWADVVLIGLKQQDIDRFGLGWDRMSAINPALVQVVLTAYGPLGPDADRGGYDVLVQALSGLGFVMNRTSRGVPETTRPAFIDFNAGNMATSATLAALRHSERTGVGQRVDVSLLGAAMNLGIPMLSQFAVDAEVMTSVSDDLDLLRRAGADFESQRALYESRVVALGGVWMLYFRPYLTTDGLVTVAGMSPALFDRFHEVTGLPRLPSGALPGDSVFDAVISEAEALFATESTSHWLETLGEVGYPCMRYNDPISAVFDPQVRANDYTIELEHPAVGPHTTVGMPFQMAATPTGVPGRAPLLGEHTGQVLAELGFDQVAIDALVQTGAFGLARE